MRDQILQDLFRHCCERVARVIADTNQHLDDPHDAITLALDVHFYLFSTLIGTLIANSPPDERDPREFEKTILELQQRYIHSKSHKQMMAAFQAGVMVRDIMRKAGERNESTD